MKKLKVIIPAAAVVLLAAAAVLFWWCGTPPGTGNETTLEIQRGWGVDRISRVLADSGLVRCRLHFLWRYSRMEGSPPLQAGKYLLSDCMTADSMLRIMADGRVVPVKTSWVTLPPGVTLERSLEIVSDSLNIPLAHLDSLAVDSAFLSSLGLVSLEGYMYPESYEFADSLQPEQIIDRIVETGERNRPENVEELLQRNGLTMHETMTLASIVEREARLDSERPLVAGVFLNRLRRGMRLESCATVQYALGEVKEELLYSDLEIEDPYNTYLYEGLPPGPICSPGQASILAAFDPDTSQGYLYFVSREDGSGGHLFAVNHAGHLANIRQARNR
ncbi:MAG: endolytic transglycosylase MltG [Candidatus Aegiribacteria sp.]|nr:endolytic transglycosylase MltG [Candidatus Aegiribacteria sp.]MBD3295731.1 endolytic transglycosylase MltG [Candidatus Fermentibacteria bacterium]